MCENYCSLTTMANDPVHKKSKIVKAQPQPATDSGVVHSKTKDQPKDQSKMKIRLKIRAYDYKIIDQATRNIIEAVLKTGVKVRGPIPLPTAITKYTVNKSTFVHKNAREQYEMRVHKRLVDILDPKPKTIDELMGLALPAGVDVEIKM